MWFFEFLEALFDRNDRWRIGLCAALGGFVALGLYYGMESRTAALAIGIPVVGLSTALGWWRDGAREIQDED